MLRLFLDRYCLIGQTLAVIISIIMKKVWGLIRIRNLFLLLAFFVLLTGSAYLLVKNIPQGEVKSFEESLSENGQSTFFLSTNETEAVFESAVFKAQFNFNAIALHWEEENIFREDMRRVFLKTSTDGETWTEWMELDSLDPLRDNDPKPNRTFPEVPFLVDGRFFQYKVMLKRDSFSVPSPHLSDFKATYINSKTSPYHKTIGKLKKLFNSVEAVEPGPKIISRAEWGSPDPYGDLFKGTGRYWKPSYVPVTQIFIHHTVFNNTSDPAAAVRAIWEFHTYTRGWGDIGYNYLVDQNGNIYEGRFGGDNVVGGHAYSFNRGSLGVAVLGCFETSSGSCQGAPPPSSAMIDGLTTILAWKSTNYEINPNTTHTFCGTRSCKKLWTISGHKDVSATACPGNLIYNQLSKIRANTSNKKGGWGYSAKQMDFKPIKFLASNTDQSITLRLKNTGTAVWSNTTNRLFLKTANPDGRVSAFQGTGWINKQTPAALNEAKVAPGETGTFTFNLKTPSLNRGDHVETFRLTLENGLKIPQMFTLVVQVIPDTLTDIVTFYDYGDCETRLHAFISTANGFSYQGSQGWWSSTNYCASAISQAVSGDFDGDGDDDIATFFDYGNNETRIHVFKANSRSFEYQGSQGWWSATGYNASKVKYALSGDFNNDGKDDIAGFYDYGSGESRIHVWLSVGDSFKYQWSSGWWNVKGYWLSSTADSVAEDFNGDGRADLAIFYDYGSGESRIHVWLSNGTSFRYQGSSGWWKVKGYYLKSVASVLPGFFNTANETNREDIVTIYDYPGSETRIHAFSSTGSRFSYQGSQGWWSSFGYDTQGIKKAVSGYFGR